MLNKLIFVTKFFCFIILSFLTTISFAYTIGQELTITNNTDKNMRIEIDKINNQAAVSRFIPAHSTTKLYTENGDNSGMLYTLSKTPFRIKDDIDKTEYINGSIVFYVGSAHFNKYSFLNAVSAGKEIELTMHYSCNKAGDGFVFKNEIILGGKPSTAASKQNTTEVYCTGLESSQLDSKFQMYTPVCKDGMSRPYVNVYCLTKTLSKNNKKYVHTDCLWQDVHTGHYEFMPTVSGELAENIRKGELDADSLLKLKNIMDTVGNQVCGSSRF